MKLSNRKEKLIQNPCLEKHAGEGKVQSESRKEKRVIKKNPREGTI